ncbi:hypothetical protein U6N94_07130, partial [Cutibacterium acnes]
PSPTGQPQSYTPSSNGSKYRRHALVGAAGLYALILDLSAVVEVSWPAVVTASALGCWWGPWVMVGRSSR